MGSILNSYPFHTLQYSFTFIMKVFIVLALIAACSARKLVFESMGHEFSDCGGSKMTLASLEVSPDPIPVPGKITASAAGVIKEDLSADQDEDRHEEGETRPHGRSMCR